MILLTCSGVDNSAKKRGGLALHAFDIRVER